MIRNNFGGESMIELNKENFQAEILDATGKIFVFFSGDG